MDALLYSTIVETEELVRTGGHIYEIWFSFGFLLEQELADRIVVAGAEL